MNLEIVKMYLNNIKIYSTKYYNIIEKLDFHRIELNSILFYLRIGRKNKK